MKCGECSSATNIELKIRELFLKKYKNRADNMARTRVRWVWYNNNDHTYYGRNREVPRTQPVRVPTTVMKLEVFEALDDVPNYDDILDPDEGVFKVPAVPKNPTMFNGSQFLEKKVCADNPEQAEEKLFDFDPIVGNKTIDFFAFEGTVEELIKALMGEADKPNPKAIANKNQ